MHCVWWMHVPKIDSKQVRWTETACEVAHITHPIRDSAFVLHVCLIVLQMDGEKNAVKCCDSCY